MGKTRSKLSFLLLLFLAAVTQTKVIMLFEYCRHGARGSLADLHNGSQWIKEWGVEQLTGIGMRMQHYLGRTMRNNYQSIFDESFNVSQMDAYATNFNRTIASGLSQFTGLFDMFKGPDLPFDESDSRLQPPKLTINPQMGFKTALPKGYTPIPIYSKLNQRIMQIIRDDCPYANKRALAAKKSLGEYLLSKPKVLELVKEGALKYGINDISDINYKGRGDRSIDIETLFFLGDFTLQDYLHNPNPTIPKYEQGNPSILYHQLEAAYSIATLARFNDTDFTRSVISDLLYEIKSRMEKKIVDPTYQKRFVLYSGHDDMITAILQAIGYLDPTCLINSLIDGVYRQCRPTPDLASAIIWELHEENNRNFIKVKYNADYIDFCGLKNANQEYRCSMQQFSKRLETIANKNFKEWCARGDELQEYQELEIKWRYITIGLLTLFVVLVIGFSITSYKLYKEPKDSNEELGNTQIEEEQYLSMGVKPDTTTN